MLNNSQATENYDFNCDFFQKIIFLKKNKNKMRIKMLALLIVFTVNNAFCQEKWNVYKTYNSKLAGNTIYDIVEDKKGNKWISTDHGVSKFDGTNWSTFNTSNSGLTSNKTGRIKIDKKGNKWIDTDKGICKFDDINWTVYNKMDGVLGGDYLSSFDLDTAGNLWAFSGKIYNYTIGKFDGQQWTKYNANNSIFNGLCWAITIDSLNNKWIGSDKGLFKFDDINWTKFDTTNSQISNNFIKKIKIDQKGRKWIITYHDNQYDKLSIFNDTIWKTFNNSEIVNYSAILNDVTIDQEEKAWVATGNGVARYDGKTWFNYTVNNSPLIDSSNNMISTLNALNVMVDKNNIKWIGTTNGIFTLDTHLPSPPVCDSVFFVKMDKNDSVFCQGFVDLYISEENKMNGYQWSINKRNDSIYSGPFSVVNQYSFNNPLEQGKYEISVIGYDHKGCKSKPTNVIITVLPRPKVKIDKIDSIIYKNAKPIPLKGIPAGGIFFGNGIVGDTLYPTKSNLGLMSITYQYKDSLKCSNTYIKIVAITDTTKNMNNVDYVRFDTSNSGLLNNTINDIAFDKQNICWIGTNNGLTRFDGNIWTTYTTSNSSISNNKINSIALDTLGNKWITTSTFLNELKVDSTWGIFNLTKPTNCIAIDKKNNKWIGTNDGFFKFNELDSSWSQYNHQTIGLSGSIIHAITSSNELVWLGTEKGLTNYNTKWNTTEYLYDSINSNMPTNLVNALLIDAKENIWIGTNKGLCKMNHAEEFSINGTLDYFNTKNSGLLNDTIVSLSLDTNGNILIGTKNGLTIFNGKKWETCLSNKRGNLNSEIISSAIDLHGNKWIGTKNGLYKLKNATTASIKETINNKKILVYPNPAKNNLYVSNLEPHTDIYLLDINGRVIYQETTVSDKLEIKLQESIQKGIYFLQATQNGNLVGSEKIVIE